VSRESSFVVIATLYRW